VNRFGCEAADVLGDRPIIEERGCAGTAQMAQDELSCRYRGDHPLEEIIRLGHEGPVPRAQRPLARGVCPHMAGRDDVEERHFTNAIRMIERQSMRRPRTPVVTGQKESVVAERRHDIDLILSHGPERVVDVVGATIGRADAVAVAAEVRRDNVKPFCQAARDLVPRRVRERVAVQQQERRAVSGVPEEDVCTAGPNPPRFEALEQANIGRKLRRCHRRRRPDLRGGLTNLSDERRSEGRRRGGDELPAVKLHGFLRNLLHPTGERLTPGFSRGG